MSKEKVILALKVISAVVAAILSVLTASSFVSCTVQRAMDAKGHTTIVTVDTTHIDHVGTLKTK